LHGPGQKNPPKNRSCGKLWMHSLNLPDRTQRMSWRKRSSNSRTSRQIAANYFPCLTTTLRRISSRMASLCFWYAWHSKIYNVKPVIWCAYLVLVMCDAFRKDSAILYEAILAAMMLTTPPPPQNYAAPLLKAMSSKHMSNFAPCHREWWQPPDS
jgi:hypothetical protein